VKQLTKHSSYLPSISQILYTGMITNTLLGRLHTQTHTEDLLNEYNGIHNSAYTKVSLSLFTPLHSNTFCAPRFQHSFSLADVLFKMEKNKKTLLTTY